MMALADGWVSEPLSDVATFDIGRTPARANASYWSDDREMVAWVAISDMKQYEPVIETAERISGAAFRDVFRQRLVPAGTLLMSFKLTIGRVAFLGVPACHNEAIISIFPRDGVDQRYLGYYLSQFDFGGYQDRQIKGNTLNRSKLERVPVWLPSTADEQRAIADVLDTVRRAIRIESAAVTAASDLKRGTIRQFFSYGLRGRDQQETELGAVPSDWVSITVGDLGQVVTGTTPPTRDVANYTPGTVPFVAPGDFSHGESITGTAKHLSETGLSRSRPIPIGSTCFVCIGSTIGKVGITSFPVCATNQQINAVVPADQFHERYVFHLLTRWSDHIKGHASPSPVPILSKGAFERLEIFTSVDKGEQSEIAEILDLIDQKIVNHRNRVVLLEQLFTELLHRLVRGRIRVNELDLSGLAAGAPAAAEAAGAPA